jgi:hypothetical protein
MKLRIDLHDSVIAEVKTLGEWTEIIFEKLVILNIKDHFGFDFDTMPSKAGKIRLKKAKCESMPTPGSVGGGKLGLGDVSYGNCLPLDLSIKQPCYLFLQQSSGDHMIFAEEIEISVK